MPDLVGSKTKRLIAFDGTALAKKAGNIMSLNIVLLGALIRTEILPLTAVNVKMAIRTSTKKAFLDTNLKAFDLGYAAVDAH